MQWYNGAEFNKMAYNIGSIGYRYPSRYGTFSITYSNLKIYIMHTSATSLSTTFANNYGTDRTLCLSKSSYTWTKTAIAPNIQDDFTMIPLDFPFKYDGRSNVVVEIQYTSGSPNTYNYFEAGSNTNIHRMWANSPTATSGSVGSNYGLCTKFVGGVGGEMVNEVVFSSATAYNNGAKLLMDSDSNLYSVYTDREGTKPTQISISNSSDLGESWFQNPVTKATTRQLEPSVAIDSKDVLHVVWRGLVSSYYQIHYANSANGGVSWANQKTITSTSAHNYAPSIALDSDNKAHIVWHGGTGSNIYYTTRTSTGTWGSVSALNSNIGEYAAIAVDSEDDLHVVWSGQRSWTSTDNIQYMKYDSSATSWSSVTMLTNSSSNDNGHPSIAIDRNDNIHITWHAEPSPNKIMHMKWDAGTSSWMSAEIVSTNASANNMNPSVGVDHRGYVYVFWFKTNPYMIMMSMFDDRYWTGDLDVTSLRELNKTTWHAGVLSSGGKLPARGSAVVFTADNGTADNVYYIPTRDLNLTDYGPWKGIPKMRHLYRDDNPTKSERNIYTAKIRVRDDDTGIGTWSMRFEVRNVWPEIKEKEWVGKVEGLENMLYSPKIKFKDPGSGPTENWTMWMDMDNSENWTAGDHFFDDPGMYDVEVINDVSHVTINPMLVPCNDDYEGRIGVYIYDDDIPDKKMFWNVTWVETMGKVLLVNKSTTTDSYEKILYDWFEVQAKKEGWKFDYKPWSTSLNFSAYSMVILCDAGTSSFYTSHSKTIKTKILDQNISLYIYGRSGYNLMQQLSLGTYAYHGYFGFVYNYIIGNYAGITTGYTGTVYLTTGGSPQGYTIERYTNFNGAELFSVYSGDQTEVCFGVYDRYNSSHTFNGATGDRNTGRVPAKVAYYAQTFTATPTFRNEWDTMMNRTIKWMLLGAPNQGVVKTHELKGYKGWIDIKTDNVLPTIDVPDVIYVLPTEEAQIQCKLYDQGSDDIYLRFEWGDGSPAVNKVYYNNEVSPEPVYPPTSSAFYGTAPFTKDIVLSHLYPDTTKDYNLTISIWDDDCGFVGHYNKTVRIHVVSAYELKEEAIKMLEPLVPGRMEVLGYRNITIQYNGKVDPTLLVYNYIARPPFYWSEKLLMTVCNVKQGSIIEINGSGLEEGMFGTELRLKLYNANHILIDSSSIPTTYSCLDYLEVGDTYGSYTVLGFGEVEGMTYHHYSYYALKVEDALDHIYRSLNKDPRRGYGWWHQIWVWMCGYWEFRELWIDDNRLDPEFGSVVFCEERWATRRLMEVVLNCLHPDGVWEVEFEYMGQDSVDVEVYTLKEDWWNGTWMWIHREYNLNNGDTFSVDGSMKNATKLGRRLMFRVYDADGGDFIDNVYVRTSGEWPMEVRPGNVYNDWWLITDSTLVIGDNYTQWKWWGDYNWWDIYFDLWARPLSRGCGWNVDDCYDTKVANEEKERVCTNLTIIMGAMEMLVSADKVLAMMAYSDAENMTVMNSSYAMDYLYYMKQSKRFFYSAGREAAMGRPHHAITDYKLSWKYANMARMYALRSSSAEDLQEFYDNCDDCYYCCDNPCGGDVPWWSDWYDDDDDQNGNGNGDDDDDDDDTNGDGIKIKGFGRGLGFWKTNIGKHLDEIPGKPQVSKADIIKYLKAISEQYGCEDDTRCGGCDDDDDDDDNGNGGIGGNGDDDCECYDFLTDLTLEKAYEILCIPEPYDHEDKAQAHILAMLLTVEFFKDLADDEDAFMNRDVYLLHLGHNVVYDGDLSGAIEYILGLYCKEKFEAAKDLAEAVSEKP
jgi:hypothetical protein